MIRIIRLGILLSIFGIQSTSSFAQALTQKTKDTLHRRLELDSVAVHGRKLLATDIMDSVSQYADRNYPLYPYLASVLSISLRARQDTFFSRVDSAYFVHAGHNLDYYFLTLSKKNTNPHSINKLNAAQRLRMVEFDHYPLESFRKQADKIKGDVRENRVFVSYQNEDSSYHLLMLYNEPQIPPFAEADVGSGYVEVVSYCELVIHKLNWAIVKQISVSAKCGGDVLKKTKEASFFDEAERALVKIKQDTKAKTSVRELHFKRTGAHEYLIDRCTFTNDLFLLSHNLLKKATNPEKSVYRYEVRDIQTIQEKPQGIHLFKLKAYAN